MSSLKEKLFPEWINDSEEKICERIWRHPHNVKYVAYPSEKMQLTVISYNKRFIKYIRNPIENVQLKAVRFDGLLIQDIHNPTKKVQLAAIENDPRSIEYIRNPSEDIQMEAIIKSNFDPDIILHCPDWRKLWDKIQDLATIKDIIE